MEMEFLRALSHTRSPDATIFRCELIHSLVMPLHEYVDVSLPDPCSRAAGSTLEIYTLSRTSVSPDPSRVRRKGSAHKRTQTLCTPPPEHFTVWWWWQVLWCANNKSLNCPTDQGCSHQWGISEYTSLTTYLKITKSFYLIANQTLEYNFLIIILGIGLFRYT